MNVANTVAALRKWRRPLTGRVVFVPTMGALHSGHAALVRSARKASGSRGAVVVSIFVNPSQFGPGEDFSRYPRTLRADLALCRDCGADAVFAPSTEEMDFGDRSVFVEESSLSTTLCGRSRPGHFRGVCTVVAKLFLIVQPTHALFGEKDWQQLAVIRRMVRDLNFPVEVLGHPTVRETDGLAMSSRNAYLDAGERSLAPRIYAALLEAASRKLPRAVESAARREIEKIPGTRIDYVEAVDAGSLQRLANRRSPGRLAAAIFLGKTRLIDNVPLPPVP